MNTPFLIAIVKPVIFKDRTGAILKSYEPGDVIQASADTAAHYVTPMGGIYHDEARLMHPDELVTYVHSAPNVRFRQYAKDPLPAWASDVRVDAPEQVPMSQEYPY